jgi:Cysteine-rich secretory protein family
MSMSKTDKPVSFARTRSRLLVAIVLAGACLTALFSAAPAMARRHGHRLCKWENSHARQVGIAKVRHAVLCLINDERKDFGLPQFRVSKALNNAAQNWANTMVATGNSGNGDLGAQISAAGYNWSQAGSVVGSGFPTAARMVRGWMGDPGHCTVILDPVYRSVGTGVNAHAVAGNWRGGATFSEDYGVAMGQSAASSNWGPADHCPY